MQLRIEDPKHILDIGFIDWIKKYIKSCILNNINIGKLKIWNTYLESLPMYWDIYKKHKKSAQDILIFAANNLNHTISGTTYTVYISDTIYTPYISNIKLIELCKLINYGDLTCPGYPIFTKVFEDIASNIQDIVEDYLLTH